MCRVRLCLWLLVCSLVLARCPVVVHAHCVSDCCRLLSSQRFNLMFYRSAACPFKTSLAPPNDFTGASDVDCPQSNTPLARLIALQS